MPCTEPDVQGNGEENWGRTKEQHCWEQAPKKGQQAPPPPPSLSLGDRIQPWGMCSCLCRGLAPGTPSAPTPEAGTEHPVPQPLRVSPARLSLQAASSTAG